MDEVWKNIIGFERYQVSTKGRIRSLFCAKGLRKTPLILTPKKEKDGYLRILLISNNNERKTLNVHRLVLLTFKGKDENKEQVNHINGLKDDNRLENLEWVTQSENMKHAYRLGLEKPVDNGLKKSVLLIKENKIIKKFVSIRSMCRDMGFDRRCVQRTIFGINSNHHGYTFKIV